MQLLTLFTAIAALTSAVHAIPQAERPIVGRRGVYERPAGIYVGSTMPMPMSSPTAPCGTPAMPMPASMSMPASMPASAAPPSKTHYVVVGGSAGLKYTPEFIFAEIGETVIFHFGTKNHTLTQSTFAQPCLFKAG